MFVVVVQQHNDPLTLWTLVFVLVNTVSLDVPDADETETIGAKKPRVVAVCLHCRDNCVCSFCLQHKVSIQQQKQQKQTNYSTQRGL